MSSSERNPYASLLGFETDDWLDALRAAVDTHGRGHKYVGYCLELPTVGLDVIPAFPRGRSRQLRRLSWWVRAFNGRAESYGKYPVAWVNVCRSGRIVRRPFVDSVRQSFINVGVHRFNSLRFQNVPYERRDWPPWADFCPWLPDKKSAGYPSVYFLAALDAGRVKIGYAGDVSARRKALSQLSPFPLTLLGTLPGSRKDETKMHRRFDALRLHGEWFSLKGDLVPFLYDKFEWQMVK